ncbi:MAG: tripartite tricarboxylate transporter TctB family protein [Rhodospirillales bacterium]|nr:tripartite tricarboxylate transporter TctB family protein [Rhodospirillales bacterium]
MSRDVSSANSTNSHVDIDTPTARGDVVAAALCLGCGLAGYFLVIPDAVYVPKSFIGTANSPAFLPKVICIMLSALSATYLVKSIAQFRGAGDEPRSRMVDWCLAGAMAAICAGYVAGILVFGLTFASAVCVAGTLYFFGERRLAVIATIAVILPSFLWYFFAKIAIILLPTPVLNILGPFSALDGFGDAARVLVAQSLPMAAGWAA